MAVFVELAAYGESAVKSMIPRLATRPGLAVYAEGRQDRQRYANGLAFLGD